MTQQFNVGPLGKSVDETQIKRAAGYAAQMGWDTCSISADGTVTEHPSFSIEQPATDLDPCLADHTRLEREFAGEGEDGNILKFSFVQKEGVMQLVKIDQKEL